MDLKEMLPIYDERKPATEDTVVPPLPLPKACCGTCSYARQSTDNRALRCQKYAPRPAVGQKTPVAAWPFVELTDWCGEFKLKES